MLQHEQATYFRQMITAVRVHCERKWKDSRWLMAVETANVKQEMKFRAQIAAGLKAASVTAGIGPLIPGSPLNG